MKVSGAALFTALFGLVVAEDVSLSYSDVHVKILGQSGKMMIGTTEDPSQDPNRVTVDFVSMIERSSTGSEVGKGSAGHSFNSFSTTDFTFGKIYQTTLGESAVNAIDFNATLTGGASLKVTTFVITKAGNFKLNKNETLPLRVGGVKFNIEVENWPFCTANGSGDALCKNGKDQEVGEYLDFAIGIKGKGAAKKTESKKYELGDGIEMDLSSAVEVDGVWTSLPDGFPSVSTSGSEQTFTFRFPRFSNKIMYDPVIYASTPSSVSTLIPSLFLSVCALAFSSFRLN